MLLGKIVGVGVEHARGARARVVVNRLIVACIKTLPLEFSYVVCDSFKNHITADLRRATCIHIRVRVCSIIVLGQRPAVGRPSQPVVAQVFW